MKYEHLFSPIKIRSLELKNRVMIPGMVTKMADNRFVTQQLIDYHTARAKGGVGINFIEATSVHQPSAPKSFLSIGEDEYIAGLKKLTDSIHAAGGKAGIQLWQGGLVATILDPSAEAVIPSEVNMAVTVVAGGDDGGVKFPAASKDKIHEVVQSFGKAARRAVEAGFDCVEVHVAHGYSCHVFLSPAFNHRTDEYGGSFENRARFALECIEEVRKNIPEEMPLFIRVVAQDDNLEDGLTVDDIIRFCKMAKEKGVDAVNVSRGNSFTAGYMEGPSVDFPRGFNVANAAKIKKETGMTTIAVGRINDPQQAEDIIAGGQADIVVMGRAHIADPEFCNKAKSGNEDAIVRCVGCNQGCNDIVASVEPGHITCLMNPAVGREKEFEYTVTNHPKKVLIVGGGIAGIEAAIMLKERGHQPIIIEKTGSLGGQFHTAGQAPRKEEFKDAIEDRAAYAAKIGVEIRTSTLCTPELIEQEHPDHVIIAAGANPIRLSIPGADRNNVYQANDILNGKVSATGTTAVIGGGLVGVEAAEYLASRGHQVAIIEMLGEIAHDMGAMRKVVVMENLKKEPVTMYTSTKCREISDGKIIAEKDGNTIEIPCDSVVFAVGSRPVDTSDLQSCCKKNHIPYDVVGDAKEVRRAMEAVADAADAVLAMTKKD